MCNVACHQTKQTKQTRHFDSFCAWAICTWAILRLVLCRFHPAVFGDFFTTFSWFHLELEGVHLWWSNFVNLFSMPLLRELSAKLSFQSQIAHHKRFAHSIKLCLHLHQPGPLWCIKIFVPLMLEVHAALPIVLGWTPNTCNLLWSKVMSLYESFHACSLRCSLVVQLTVFPL